MGWARRGAPCPDPAVKVRRLLFTVGGGWGVVTLKILFCCWENCFQQGFRAWEFSPETAYDIVRPRGRRRNRRASFLRCLSAYLIEFQPCQPDHSLALIPRASPQHVSLTLDPQGPSRQNSFWVDTVSLRCDSKSLESEMVPLWWSWRFTLLDLSTQGSSAVG